MPREGEDICVLASDAVVAVGVGQHDAQGLVAEDADLAVGLVAHHLHSRAGW